MLRSFVRCSPGWVPSVTPQSERLHAMFKELDIDGSGKLDVAEVAKVGCRTACFAVHLCQGYKGPAHVRNMATGTGLFGG